MKVALIHDHLVQDGGAEKVLLALQDVFPDAPTFTLLHDADRMSAEFRGKDIRTSFLQTMPLALRKYQWYLPLMPAATESYDLSEFDVVLSSSSAFAKGVRTRPGSLHLCYCHTPTRYLWTDSRSYVQELRVPRPVKWLLPAVLNRLRIWDRMAADRVDRFIANSRNVAERIRKYYLRDSDVLYPPVETSKFSVSARSGDYYLAGGRLVSYKRFDLLIDVFNQLGLKLKIFGDGPMLETYRRMARPNIEFVGRVSDADQAELYRTAIAYLHPQEEDFGITPLEAMASGRPVIAYRKGGALETILEGVTGTFFDVQNADTLKRVISGFDAAAYDPARIRAHAVAFDTEEFKKRITSYVADTWSSERLRQAARAADARLSVREFFRV